jgi:hypothetical protein
MYMHVDPNKDGEYSSISEVLKEIKIRELGQTRTSRFIYPTKGIQENLEIPVLDLFTLIISSASLQEYTGTLSDLSPSLSLSLDGHHENSLDSQFLLRNVK